MQLKKLSPLAGLMLTAVLSACGGGGDDEPAAPAAPPPPAITVSAVALSSTSPAAYADNVLVFDGGVCDGGTGTLTATWDFGDGTTPVVNPGANPTHTYAEEKAGPNAVTVNCADTAGTAIQTNTLKLTIQSAAMQGFLGKSWTPYSSIESNTNASPYPVAGITTAGDVYGVWVRRYDTTAGNNEVVAGTTSFSQNTWNVAPTAFNTNSEKSPYVDSLGGTFGESSLTTAPIDIAVSPNGYVLAAWKTGTSPGSIWFATKSPQNTSWSTPTQINVTAVTDDSIKVVVNDAGNGAIAYCESNNAAKVISDINNPTNTPILISKKCGELDNTAITFQRHRAFDIAIDKNSATIYAVGVTDAPGSTSVVSLQEIAGAGTTVTEVSDRLATAPETVSLSRSPNGNRAAIAWSQLDGTHTNVYIAMLNGTSWPKAAFAHAIAPNTNYSRPLIAVNDKGDAFLAMTVNNGSGTIAAVANYDATATIPAWSTEVSTGTKGFRATDIAIDNWGTGLITHVDDNLHYTEVGTFAKKGAKQWSGFKIISSAKLDTVYYNGFHYQTMRALPDGQAIVVTSMYDSNLNSGPHIPSGYMLLK